MAGWGTERADLAGVVDAVAARLRGEGALGALLIGSVARGAATSASDVDVLVVDPEGSDRQGFERVLDGPVLVEVVAKTDRGWRDHLRGQRPRWVYAFLDGRALFDDGSIDRLQQLSRTVYDDFVTPAEVKQELATLLWHGRAKTERAAGADDADQAAYWSALLVPTLLDALLALADRPTAPGSRRLDVLATTKIAPQDHALLAVALTGEPRDRLRSTRELAASLLDRLGPPDLERIDW